MIEVIGLAGIAISIAAYVPQVVHLVKEHCSAGISVRAWAMWLLGAVLVSIVAVDRQDPVFIVLQGSTLTSAAVILVLAHKYRESACESHVPAASTQVQLHTNKPSALSR